MTTQLGNADENFLSAADERALSNSALPVFSTLTCAVGIDSQADTAFLAGTLVRSLASRSIAALAPTRPSLDADVQVIVRTFTAALPDNRMSVGEVACLGTK